MITVQDKKSFINWFLENYSISKREAAWLLTYISSNNKILEKVHFVEDVQGLPKSIQISTECVTMTPFKFYKNNRVTPDVETAFLDIRSNPDEELYIGLFFKNRDKSPEYAAILEGNPMEKQKMIKDSLLDLLAELVLDESIRIHNKEELYRGIDKALADGDKEKFLDLTNKLNQILKEEKK